MHEVLYQIGTYYAILLWFLYLLFENYVMYRYINNNNNNNNVYVGAINDLDSIDWLSNSSLLFGTSIALIECVLLNIAYFSNVNYFADQFWFEDRGWTTEIEFMFVGNLLVILGLFILFVLTFWQIIIMKKIEMNKILLHRINLFVLTLLIGGLIIEFAGDSPQFITYVWWVNPLSAWYGYFVVISNVSRST